MENPVLSITSLIVSAKVQVVCGMNSMGDLKLYEVKLCEVYVCVPQSRGYHCEHGLRPGVMLFPILLSSC